MQHVASDEDKQDFAKGKPIKKLLNPVCGEPRS